MLSLLACCGLSTSVKSDFRGCVTGSLIGMFVHCPVPDAVPITPRFVNVSSADASVRLCYDVSSYSITIGSTHKLQYLYIVSFRSRIPIYPSPPPIPLHP